MQNFKDFLIRIHADVSILDRSYPINLNWVVNLKQARYLVLIVPCCSHFSLISSNDFTHAITDHVFVLNFDIEYMYKVCLIYTHVLVDHSCRLWCW